MSASVCLWGWREHDLSYEYVTGQRAYCEGLKVIGNHSVARDIVIVLRSES